MAAAEPGVHLWFVLGADQLAGVPSWRDPDRILAAARLAVVAREGVDDGELIALAERIAPGRHDIVRMPAIGVSSTMIRDRMAAGSPWATCFRHRSRPRSPPTSRATRPT